MRGEIDSWTFDDRGIKYRIDIDPDYESNTDGPRANDDGMRDETADAHARGEWRYVGVTLTPLIDGLDSETYSPLADSLWCVEWGDLPATVGNAYPPDDPRYGPDDPPTPIGRERIQSDHPGPDMVACVRANLAKLRDTLTALNLDSES